ncbi:50S ribosome-binding GTPase [Micrococcales bacterium 31B]|nr:50S ribosome-binding GTPase [Micrococcales bacterium 31B]
MTPQQQLRSDIDSLEALLDDHEARFDPSTVGAVRETLLDARERIDRSNGRVVICLAGATGSGKSSTFNAITKLDFAAVDVRRPTTTQPSACVWGDQPANDLLDWLGVDPVRRARRESVLSEDQDDLLDNVILLDLPDHDSRVIEHARFADRLVGLVDLVVWVVDPQKYADDALHTRYLRTLGGRDAHMICVLNQIDRLTEENIERCKADIKNILADDGLPDVEVYGISALTGEGIPELREIFNEHAALAKGPNGRMRTEIRVAARRLLGDLAAVEPDVERAKEDPNLLNTVASIAGAERTSAAIEIEFVQRSIQATKWPLNRAPSKITRAQLKPTRVGTAEVTRIEAASRQVRDEINMGLPIKWQLPTQDRKVVQRAVESIPNVVKIDPKFTDPKDKWSSYRAQHFAMLGVAGVGVIFAIVFAAIQLVWGIPLGILLAAGGLVGGWMLGRKGAAEAEKEGARVRARAEEQWLPQLKDIASEALGDVDTLVDLHRRVREQLSRLA